MDVCKILLLLNALSTFYMVGLIWMVQVVHYPLFALVGPQHYVEFQRRHQNLTTFVVGPPMLIEAFTSVFMLWYPPNGVNLAWVWSGIVLLAVIWFSTAVIQVPCHHQLTTGFEPATHQRLVRSNWIRTVAWTARGGLLSWWLGLALSTL